MLLGIFVLISLSVIACPKYDSVNKTGKFDTKTAREWYYEVFKKSPEWLATVDSAEGEEIPNWYFGTYKKVG